MLVRQINPVHLSGLTQALYVMRALVEGKTVYQIVDEFQGDRQLVGIWTSFLIENQWIERTKAGGFAATKEGREWFHKIGGGE